MPLYEYECDACGHRFEIIQKFSDPPIERCPKCGAPVHKMQSAPAFQFKGSGWYITDYAKKDQGKPGKTEGDSKDAVSVDKGEKGETGEKSGTGDKKDSATEKKDAAPKAEKAAEKSAGDTKSG